MNRRAILIIAIVICLLAYLPQLASEEPTPDRAEGTLMVEFLDVEQGDSALIHLPNGETMLIDAGESAFVWPTLPARVDLISDHENEGCFR